MAIGDIFKASKIKAENEDLKSLLSPELKNAADIQALIRELEKTASQLENQIHKSEGKLESLNSEIERKKQMVISLDDDILVQEFGLYQPHYQFQLAEEYAERLRIIREKQKQAIKNNTAVSGNQQWAVDGSKSKGSKMIKDMQKLLLRAFNGECDDLIEKVKYNNYDASLKRITASRDAISKLGAIMGISITSSYYLLKIEELRLALEYQIKKQEEKEALKEARAEMREAAKLQKEIEAQRKKIEKEQSHYQSALNSVLKQLENSTTEEREALLRKKEALEKELNDIEISLKDIDYREANQRAGYVYIISNIGSFGENIYKIGMTRRLDPQDRIDELGDASVPFNFDVHAMIFSDDAPKLESALHKAFEDRKVNMVNYRREFFHVTLEEIKEVIRENFDKTVEFIDTPDADQFRQSVQLSQQSGFPLPIRQASITSVTEKSHRETGVPPKVQNASDYTGEVIYTKYGMYKKPSPYIAHIERDYYLNHGSRLE